MKTAFIVGPFQYAVVVAFLFASTRVMPAEVIVRIDPYGNPAAEPWTSGAFWLKPETTLSSPLTVYYTVGGSAAAGRHYLPLGGSATIPPGPDGTLITVTPINNTAYELFGPAVSITFRHVDVSCCQPSMSPDLSIST